MEQKYTTTVTFVSDSQEEALAMIEAVRKTLHQRRQGFAVRLGPSGQGKKEEADTVAQG